MAPNKCAYYKCHNTSDRIPMFRFPCKHPKRLQIWLSNSGNQTIAHLNHNELRNRYLCLDHFEERFVQNVGGARTRINKSAIPTHYKEKKLTVSQSWRIPIPSESRDDTMSSGSAGTTDNEASNHILFVDTEDPLLESLGDTARKPLMMLFLRLIGNDNKQNTVLTNAQIIDILQKEFDMDILYSHELEIEIYLNLLKRFLKDWPQWDEFDFAINTLKDQKNMPEMKGMLLKNYESLKEYLKNTLEAVEPMLNKVMKEVTESTAKESTHTTDDVAITIQCSRTQLNNLFFRRPHPDMNNTILNIEPVPSKINLKTMSLESILNWPSIRITLSLNGMLFKRGIEHNLKHVLVNKKLNLADKPQEELNTNFQMKSFLKVTGIFEIDTFVKVIDLISITKMDSAELQEGVRTVCNILNLDMERAPQYMQSPTSYRQNLSKYPYVRHLYAEVNTEKFSTSNNFDLQLVETAIPQLIFHFIRFNPNEPQDIPSNASFLKIECVLCECVFTGEHLFQNLQSHFDAHRGEQDWQCTHCEVVLSMEHLTLKRWHHNCQLIKMLMEKDAASKI